MGFCFLCLLALFYNLLSHQPTLGKTTTVVEAVYQLAMQKQRILLVAPSNDAADILVERLSSYFPPTEMRRLLAYSRSVDTLPDQIQNYAREGADSEQQLAEIMSARIVVSTVNLSARFAYFKVPRGHFDVLCVDEAGHATEPEVVSVVASLMDFSGTERMGQVILAGDPKQLGPVISSVACQKLGMSVSYMERLALRNIYQRGEDGKYHPELLTKLVKNYRSHPSIIELRKLLHCVFKLNPRKRWIAHPSLQRTKCSTTATYNALVTRLLQ